MSSPAILQLYQDPQAGASWRKGLTALHFLDIGLSERGQMRLWERSKRAAWRGPIREWSIRRYEALRRAVTENKIGLMYRSN
ncbi:hypothetical protein ACN42_g4668 [Penicillium freii]|uniref:Uncharacterized protein n=1 Tax=Penicillium freii TaxID=48697 RepID=A0A117NPH4_PENFR|nr:hypothetical protein ACN42_g4668 [Penicillium freii]